MIMSQLMCLKHNCSVEPSLTLNQKGGKPIFLMLMLKDKNEYSNLISSFVPSTFTVKDLNRRTQCLAKKVIIHICNTNNTCLKSGL